MTSLTACGCGRAHDQSASCIAVAAAARRAALIIAAEADMASRCAQLLAAREDAAFHADALSALPAENAGRCHGLWHAYRTLIKELEACLEDERCATACEHDLWDGIESADIPLMPVATMIREHRTEQRRAA